MGHPLPQGGGVRRQGDGEEKKDGEAYRLRISDIGIDGDSLEQAVAEHTVQVLITSLPFSAEHSEGPPKKVSADDVIDLYLEQYRAEAGFKMMKSGMSIGNVYIHATSRITAVVFVVALATVQSIVADMVLRDRKPKGERRQTIKALADVHLNTLVWYDRRKDRMTITGRPGDAELVFTYVDRLEIDPAYLLSC